VNKKIGTNCATTSLGGGKKTTPNAQWCFFTQCPMLSAGALVSIGHCGGTGLSADSVRRAVRRQSAGPDLAERERDFSSTANAFVCLTLDVRLWSLSGPSFKPRLGLPLPLQWTSCGPKWRANGEPPEQAGRKWHAPPKRIQWNRWSLQDGNLPTLSAGSGCANCEICAAQSRELNQLMQQRWIIAQWEQRLGPLRRVSEWQQNGSRMEKCAKLPQNCHSLAACFCCFNSPLVWPNFVGPKFVQLNLQFVFGVQVNKVNCSLWARSLFFPAACPPSSLSLCSLLYYTQSNVRLSPLRAPSSPKCHFCNFDAIAAPPCVRPYAVPMQCPCSAHALRPLGLTKVGLLRQTARSLLHAGPHNGCQIAHFRPNNWPKSELDPLPKSLLSALWPLSSCESGWSPLPLVAK